MVGFAPPIQYAQIPPVATQSSPPVPGNQISP